jgi:DNA-binding response OmpR family regulator
VAEQPILIVDDDPAVVAQLAQGFIARGYCVETASNGEEALRIVDRVRPMLVLLDTEMPVLDGWGFARALHARGLRLPLVLLCDDKRASSLAREVGAAGYLSKPHGGHSMNGHGTAAAWSGGTRRQMRGGLRGG